MRRRILILFLVLTLAGLTSAQEAQLEVTWSPVRNTIRGTVDVMGSANIPDQFYFFLEAAPWQPPAEAPAWQPITSFFMSPVVAGPLGSWNTSRFPDGFYQLRLHALNNANESFHYALAPILINNNNSDFVNLEPVAAIAGPSLTQMAPAAPLAELENRLPLQVGGHIKYFNENSQAAMRSAGMTWVKKQVQFGISDGKDLIESAHAQGYKVLLGALGDKNRLAQDFDGYVAEYAEYVAYLARLGADAIEVWNEPNIDREWPLGRVSGASYVRLLKAAYEAIKAENPATMVISGAPAPTGFFAGCAAQGCDDNVFMQQMANAGAANYADCIGVHYNEGILPPTSRKAATRTRRTIETLLSAAHAAARRLGFPQCRYTDVHDRESAIFRPRATGRCPPALQAGGPDTSVAEQAAWLAQAVLIMANFHRHAGRAGHRLEHRLRHLRQMTRKPATPSSAPTAAARPAPSIAEHAFASRRYR